MVEISVDINTMGLIRDLINFLRRRGPRKITLTQFMKGVEKRYGIELSKETQEEILFTLEEHGIIKIVKSKYGKKYILINPKDEIVKSLWE